MDSENGIYTHAYNTYILTLTHVHIGRSGKLQSVFGLRKAESKGILRKGTDLGGGQLGGQFLRKGEAGTKANLISVLTQGIAAVSCAGRLLARTHLISHPS